MIDTIVAQFECRDAPPGDNWESTTTIRGSATLHRYSCVSGTVRMATYRHRDGRVRMRVEASLPKVFQGHNITILDASQIQEANIALQQEVERLAPYIPVPQVSTWSLAEVHWCHAWQVESPSTVISALAETVTQTKAQRLTHEDDGNGGLTLRRQPRSGRGEWSEQVYDKAAETQYLISKGKIDLAKCRLSAQQIVEMARGIVRYEVITRRKSLRDILGVGPTVARLQDYLFTHGSEFVQKRWERLSANWQPTPMADAARYLRAKYAPSTAADLFDFWFALSQLGAPEYRRIIKPSPEKWRRQIARLKQVGLGVGRPEHADCLSIPPFDV